MNNALATEKSKTGFEGLLGKVVPINKASTKETPKKDSGLQDSKMRRMQLNNCAKQSSKSAKQIFGKYRFQLEVPDQQYVTEQALLSLQESEDNACKPQQADEFWVGDAVNSRRQDAFASSPSEDCWSGEAEPNNFNTNSMLDWEFNDDKQEAVSIVKVAPINDTDTWHSWYCNDGVNTDDSDSALLLDSDVEDCQYPDLYITDMNSSSLTFASKNEIVVTDANGRKTFVCFELDHSSTTRAAHIFDFSENDVDRLFSRMIIGETEERLAKRLK